MNPNSLLDIEKRTGIKDDEIDEFLAKASALEEAIKNIKDGKFQSEEDINIPGFETENEKKEKYLRLEQKKIRDEEIKIQKKKEEKERWWAGSEFFRKSGNSEKDNTLEDTDAAQMQLKIKRDRYSSDYSRWSDNWQPTDPVTLSEKQQKEQEEEKLKNEEFQKNNAEFCSQFTADMAERNENIKKKEESVEELRKRGNKLYTKREFLRALELYLEGMRILPYDNKILFNIAQTYLQTRQWGEAEEFLNRVLYLDPQHTKALSRQSYLHLQKDEYPQALESASKALELDPINEDIKKQVIELRVEIEERKELYVINWIKECIRQDQMVSTDSTQNSHNILSPDSKTKNPLSLIQLLEFSKAMMSIDQFNKELQTVNEKIDLGRRNTTTTAAAAAAAPSPGTTTNHPLPTISTASLQTVITIFTSTSSTSEAFTEKKAKTCKVYFRHCGALQDSLRYFEFITEILVNNRTSTSTSTSDVITGYMTQLTYVILLFTYVCSGDFKSQELLHQQHILSTAFASLQHLSRSPTVDSTTRSNTRDIHTPSIEQSILYYAAVIKFLSSLIEDTEDKQLQLRYSAMKESISTDDLLFHNIQNMMLILIQFIDKNSKSDIKVPSKLNEQIDVIKECKNCISFSTHVIFRMLHHSLTNKTKCINFHPSQYPKAATRYPVVSVLGALLQLLFTTTSSAVRYKDCRQSVFDCLLLCSQIDFLRLYFIHPVATLATAAATPPVPVPPSVPVPPDAAKDSPPQPPLTPPSENSSEAIATARTTAGAVAEATTTNTPTEIIATTLSIIINIIKTYPECRSVCMAIVMNACVETPTSTSTSTSPHLVVKEVYRLNGVAIAMAGIGLDSQRRLGVEPTLLSRSAGLLSRLSVLEETLQVMTQPEIFRKLCRCLAANTGVDSILQAAKKKKTSNLLLTQDSSSSTQSLDSCLQDERSHLIRALASIVKPSESCLSIAKDEHFVLSVLLCFPTPRSELGEITPTSVTLPPAYPATALLLGNAARCLLPYADSSLFSTIIFATDNGFYGTERLVCAMASCSDLRVRKNIAILLAKGCKESGVVRQRIEFLRGMQMMVELQNKLV